MAVATLAAICATLGVTDAELRGLGYSVVAERMLRDLANRARYAEEVRKGHDAASQPNNPA
jgi:hypothetical protein